MRRVIDRTTEIGTRRRTLTRAGFAAMAAVTAWLVLSACFDQSDYQGGGRIDQGGSATTAMPDSSTSPEPTAQPDDASDDTFDPFDAPLEDAGGDRG